MQNTTNEERGLSGVPAEPITEEVRKHIEAVAASMIGKSNLRDCDYDDLCQDLTLQIVAAFPSFDPRRGTYYTFAQAVVSRNRDKIFRRRIRHGLDTATVSIDITMSSDGESRLSAIDEYDAAESRAKEARENLVELVHAAMDGMTETERAICELLMDGLRHVEVMKRLGIPERTYFSRVKGIRAKFKKSELF